MRKTWAALAAVFLVPACASPEQQLANATNIKNIDDQFKPYRDYATGALPGLPGEAPPGSTIEKTLVAQVDRKTGGIALGLKLEIRFQANYRHIYDEARTAQAAKLQVRNLVHIKSLCSKQWNGCTFVEVLVVDLPETPMRASMTTGVPIKLFSKTGPSLRVDIPKELIAALFAAVDAGEKQTAQAIQAQLATQQP